MASPEPIGIVSDLWRYPVKSFGGERVRSAFLGPFGALGDRRHAVLDEDGRALSARRNRAMLSYRARYRESDSAEDVQVVAADGVALDWDDPALAERLTGDLGQPITLARSPASIHDAAPIHVVSTASLAAAAEWTPGEEIDVRRFRPNVVIELDEAEPFAEADWPGGWLTVGAEGPELAVVSPTERCAVTTIDPDTLERDNRVLSGLAADRENLFGVYALVLRPGWLRVGDQLSMAPGQPVAARA